MDDAKLTLNLKRRVIKKAKIYAKKQGRSLSDLIENYLMAITSKEKIDEEEMMSHISPRIRELVGIAKNIPKNIDHKELITEYLTKKYLK